MKEMDLAGKWVLISGAGSGMGRTTALELAREGSNLIFADICGEAMGQVAREAEALGAEVHTFCVDLTDWNQVKGMADTIHSRWGAVDVLINCAGVAHMAHMVETTIEDWTKLINVNIWSIIYMVNAFGPEMMKKKSGQIVNFASGQAFFAVPTWGAYASTKNWVEGFSEALRYEMYLHHVGVTTVFPGIIKTPFYDNITGGALVKISMWFILATASKPETMTRQIVKSIRKRKKYAIQPIMWPFYLTKRVFPLGYELAGRFVAWLWRNT